MVRVFQHFAVIAGRTNAGNNTFAYSGNNGLLAGAAHQSIDISSYGYSGFNLQLNAVFSNGRNYRSFNNFRINTHLYCFQNITSCQVNSAGSFKGQRNFSTMRSNQSINNLIYITACQIVSFQLIGVYGDTGFVGLNQGQYDFAGRNSTQPHTNQVENTNIHTCCHSGNPQAQGYKIKEKRNSKN